MQRGLFRYDVTACETKVCLLLHSSSALSFYIFLSVPDFRIMSCMKENSQLVFMLLWIIILHR